MSKKIVKFVSLFVLLFVSAVLVACRNEKEENIYVYDVNKDIVQCTGENLTLKQKNKKLSDFEGIYNKYSGEDIYTSSDKKVSMPKLVCIETPENYEPTEFTRYDIVTLTKDSSGFYSGIKIIAYETDESDENEVDDEAFSHSNYGLPIDKELQEETMTVEEWLEFLDGEQIVYSGEELPIVSADLKKELESDSDIKLSINKNTGALVAEKNGVLTRYKKTGDEAVSVETGSSIVDYCRLDPNNEVLIDSYKRYISGWWRTPDIDGLKAINFEIVFYDGVKNHGATISYSLDVETKGLRATISSADSSVDYIFVYVDDDHMTWIAGKDDPEGQVYQVERTDPPKEST